jgi:hypothetical protein
MGLDELNKFSGIVVDAAMIVLELKAVTALLPVHHAQLMSYMRLKKKRVGLLINFFRSPTKGRNQPKNHRLPRINTSVISVSPWSNFLFIK